MDKRKYGIPKHECEIDKLWKIDPYIIVEGEQQFDDGEEINFDGMDLVEIFNTVERFRVDE